MGPDVSILEVSQVDTRLRTNAICRAHNNPASATIGSCFEVLDRCAELPCLFSARERCDSLSVALEHLGAGHIHGMRLYADNTEAVGI